MKHIVDMAWLKNSAFEADIDGHQIITDASAEDGGDNLGPRPKKLMLTALAGCTGIDIVMILKKMKIQLDDFHVIVEGELTDDYPKKYRKMKVIYQFKGENLPLKKLEHAVRLSEEKYCGVSAVYRDALDVESEIQLLPGS